MIWLHNQEKKENALFISLISTMWSNNANHFIYNHKRNKLNKIRDKAKFGIRVARTIFINYLNHI